MDSNYLYTTTSNLWLVDSTDVRIDPATKDSAWMITQKVPDVTWAEVLNYFTFETEGADFVTTVSTSNWQNVTCLVIDPTTDNKRSVVTQTVPIKANAHLSAIEASMNQRVRHQFSTMEMSTDDVVPVYTEYSISTLQQTTTTLTLTMASSVLDEWTIWDWINIWWCADNRINYPNFVVATISANWLVVTGTVSDEATIPSLSVWPYSTAGMKAQKRRQLLGQDGYWMRFSGTSATAAAYLTKFGANITKVTGTLVGTQTVMCASTAPTFTSGATWQVDIRTTSKFFSRCDSDWVSFFDRAIDSSAISTVRNYFSGVKPWWQKLLYAKYNAISPKSMTRPIAKIVSIAKTGTTTATVTTDIPHGLLTTNYVTIKWVRDQTNFPNLTTPTVVASTPTTTTFTIVIWPSATATSYGGSVVMCQWWVDQPWIITQVAQSLTSDATTWFVTIVGNGTWAWLNVWEYVYLHWFRNSTNGADLWYDGAWEVVTLSTTTLVVKPIFNYLGIRVSPTFTTLWTTNCWGTVILMTTLRSHDSVMSEYIPTVNQIDGQWTADVTKAIPTYPVWWTQAVSWTVTANEWTALTASNSTVTTTASTNATSIKTTAGHVYSIVVSNPTATACYLKYYNKASAPTVGTDIPTSIIPIPANSFAAYELWRLWDRFATWIALAVTWAIWATDTTNAVAWVYVKTNYI